MHDGKAKVAFLALVDIPDGGAETLFSAVGKVLADKGIQEGQLLGFGSDGASPMTGRSPCFCVSF